MNKKMICAVILCAALANGAFAQTPDVSLLTSFRPENGSPLYRAEFVSYDIRDEAEKSRRDRNQHIVPLNFTPGDNGYHTVVEIPQLWLDRQIFIQFVGLPGYELTINGRTAVNGGDSRTPVQFDISTFVTDGKNSLVVQPKGFSVLETPYQYELEAFLFSQPKIRIEDYMIRFEPDSTWGHGILDITLCLANSYNYSESVTVGYDIYSPQDKLLYYDFREVTIPGQSRDTLRFREPIWRANDNFWSAETPVLHYGQLTVKRGSRMTEYIPWRAGYGKTELQNGIVLRNRKPIEIKALRFNVELDQEQTRMRIAELKKEGYNTLLPEYPQPLWFYELTDQMGMYVIDRANIKPVVKTTGRRVGEATANDPWLLAEFEKRTVQMYNRTKNNPSVIARSPGGDAGNGFNAYRSYILLKKLYPEGIVYYNDAAGEWNSNLPRIEPDLQ